MTDTTDPSENKFTRLFKDRSIAIAQAKPKVKLGGSAIAAAIASAAARSLEPADDCLEAELLEAELLEATAALEPTTQAAIAPATDQPTDPTTEPTTATATPTKPPVQLQPQPKTTKTRIPDAPRRGRGRPAGGKRSNPNWYGRTFYIRKETDERLERALLHLRRSGIEVDKSQLADALLNAWAAVELDEADDLTIGTIVAKPAPKADR
jgi:hypothetical protein